MYHFAIVALLALAALKASDFICDNVPGVDRLRSAVTYVLSIGAVVWLDYSVFAGWDVEVRNDDIGVWATGFLVTGLTVPWRAAFRWLTHDQATADESLGERREVLREVA
jgi:hypothetical protein